MCFTVVSSHGSLLPPPSTLPCYCALGRRRCDVTAVTSPLCFAATCRCLSPSRVAVCHHVAAVCHHVAAVCHHVSALCHHVAAVCHHVAAVCHVPPLCVATCRRCVSPRVTTCHRHPCHRRAPLPVDGCSSGASIFRRCSIFRPRQPQARQTGLRPVASFDSGGVLNWTVKNPKQLYTIILGKARKFVSF